MDHTNKSTVEIIQCLKSSLSDGDELRSLLNILLKNLEIEKDTEFFPEVISILLGTTVQALPLDKVDTALLKPLLSLIKEFFFTTFNANCQTHGEVSTILKNIEACIEVLAGIDRLLLYLTSLDRLQASDFYSAPRYVTEVVHVVFCHCRDSQKIYKDVFTIVKKELMSLFQHCHQVQVKLFTLLNVKLVFNCTFEEDIQLLIHVISLLTLMSEVVADLDTMSLVAHWKAFAQLTQVYSEHLCSRLDVSQPITYLAKNIAHQLDNLKVYVNADNKVVLRALKISSLQLKVLIKLCEQYKGHLGECHQPLLSCLISLVARTPESLSEEGFTADMSAQVITYLTSGAAPLLSHLIPDPVFVENYLRFTMIDLQSNSIANKLGYCNLTNMILKKFVQLSSGDSAAKELWLKPTLPLIKTTFEILHLCSDVFLACEEDTYQTLLTHTAAFIIATTSASMFPALEQLLVQQLLQPSLWPAVFASDLLCLVARVGSSNLCLQLVSLLSDLCSGWQTWDRCRPEWCYVSWTLSRVTRFLAPEDLKSFQSRLPAVTKVATDLNTLVNQPFSNESIELYDSLMERFSLLSSYLDLFPEDKPALAQPVHQLWLHMILPADVGSKESSDWLCSLFSVLVPITVQIVDHLDNAQIGNVLNMLELLDSSSRTVFKCGLCLLLRSLANKCFLSDANQALVFNKISSLFIKLMLDRNPLMKQFALETFSYFAHVTKYEEIVANTVAKDSKLQDEITQYLECVPIMKSDTDFLEYIANLKVPFVHICKAKRSEVADDEDTEENPCKKFKTSSEAGSVSTTVKKIEEDLCSIKEFQNCSEETKKSVLKCITNRLSEII